MTILQQAVGDFYYLNILAYTKDFAQKNLLHKIITINLSFVIIKISDNFIVM
jgi:hypothetical protein